jgi:hypothetical protein
MIALDPGAFGPAKTGQNGRPVGALKTTKSMLASMAQRETGPGPPVELAGQKGSLKDNNRPP